VHFFNLRAGTDFFYCVCQHKNGCLQCSGCSDRTITIDNQQDATILIYLLQSALHVSGDVFAHRQEPITVNTASGNVHRCCCWLVLRVWWNPIRNTSQ